MGDMAKGGMSDVGDSMSDVGGGIYAFGFICHPERSRRVESENLDLYPEPQQSHAAK